MVYSFSKEPLIKRLPPYLDQTYGVQSYGADNLYPQRAEEVRNLSYTTKIAVEKTADFIYGKGFEDPILANLVINSGRQTWNKLLSFLSKDKAMIGMALHFKFNPFSYRITDINFTEFKYCRFGLPDNDGNVDDIKYHINWEMDPNKTLDKTFIPEAFPVFDPRPEIVKAQIEQYGWADYPGQILYWTPKPGVYPLCAFDPAFDDAQAQSEIGVFQLAGLQNGFKAHHFFKHPGQFEDDEKRQKFKEKIAAFQGAQANGSMMVVEVPDTERQLNLVESIQMQNTDKMHEFTSKNVKNAIRETMGVPAAIMGQLPETGMFNQEDIVNSYNYFNESTGKHRDELSEVVKEIMQYWHQPVSVTNYNILPRTYGQSATASPGQATGSPAPGQPGVAAQASPRIVDDRMARLSSAESANLERTIRKVARGRLTAEAGRALIKMSFGFSDEECKAFIP
jgi:hypothetical protein